MCMWLGSLLSAGRWESPTSLHPGGPLSISSVLRAESLEALCVHGKELYIS